MKRQASINYSIPVDRKNRGRKTLVMTTTLLKAYTSYKLISLSHYMQNSTIE